MSSSRASRNNRNKEQKVILFDKNNYILIGLGLLIICIGFILMSGGSMPDADTWDESLIYSARRITIAPITVLSGLAVIIFAIFKTPSNTTGE